MKKEKSIIVLFMFGSFVLGAGTTWIFVKPSPSSELPTIDKTTNTNEDSGNISAPSILDEVKEMPLPSKEVQSIIGQKMKILSGALTTKNVESSKTAIKTLHDYMLAQNVIEFDHLNPSKTSLPGTCPLGDMLAGMNAMVKEGNFETSTLMYSAMSSYFSKEGYQLSL